MSDAPSSDFLTRTVLDTESGEPSLAAWKGNLHPGMVLGGRFELVRFIGAGALGEVWLARDTHLGRVANREVALKFLKRSLRRGTADPSTQKNGGGRLGFMEGGQDSIAARRLDEFRKEVIRSQSVRHRNVVQVYDWHESPNEPVFYSMEYLEGENLAQHCERQPLGRMTWAELRPIAIQLAEALHEAFTEHALIHSDLKPANIILDTRHQAKLGDFGQARQLQEVGGEWVPEAYRGGTPAFMSPQQFDRESASAADDIYSYGATLYYLLTGRHPIPNSGPDKFEYDLHNYRPQSVADLLAALQKGGRSDVPTAVSHLIQRCLEKDPEKRPLSMGEVLRRLNANALRPGVEEDPARSGKSVIPALLFTLMLLSAAGLSIADYLTHPNGITRRLWGEIETVEPPKEATGSVDIDFRRLPKPQDLRWFLTDPENNRSTNGVLQEKESLSLELQPGSWAFVLESAGGQTQGPPKRFVARIIIAEGQTVQLTPEWPRDGPPIDPPRTNRPSLSGVQIDFSGFRRASGVIWRLSNPATQESRTGTHGSLQQPLEIELQEGGWILEASPESIPENQRSALNSMSTTFKVESSKETRVVVQGAPLLYKCMFLNLADGEETGVQLTLKDRWGRTRIKQDTPARAQSIHDKNVWSVDLMLLPNTEAWIEANLPSYYVATNTLRGFPLQGQKTYRLDFDFQKARHPLRDQRFTNSISMIFLPIGPFWAGSTEVSIDEFGRFAADPANRLGPGDIRRTSSAGQVPSPGHTWRNVLPSSDANHPAAGVSWEDAMRYARWLTRIEREGGYIKASQEYAIPTAAQWDQLSPRGTYTWGDVFINELDRKIAPVENLAGKEVAEADPATGSVDWPPEWDSLVIEGYTDGVRRTAKVTQFPNPLGLCNIGGNVSEWCLDTYDPSMNSPEVLADDPLYKEPRNEDFKVVRGGNWADHDRLDLRRDTRRRFHRLDRNDWIGFRLVINETQPSNSP